MMDLSVLVIRLNILKPADPCLKQITDATPVVA